MIAATATPALLAHIAPFEQTLRGDYKEIRNHDVWLSRFDSTRDKHPKQSPLSFRALFDLLSKPTVSATKEAVSLFSGARYPEGCTRCASSVESVSVLAFDYDQATDITAIDAALAAIASANGDDGYGPVPALAYTSHSHGAGKVKFRLVVPLCMPIPAALYKNVHALVGAYLAGYSEQLQYDPAPSSSASIFFLPSCKPGADFVFRHTEGFDADGSLLCDPFDWLDFVACHCTERKAPAPEQRKAPEGFEVPQAALVCKRCAVMRNEYETGGADAAEPLWFGVLRVAAACQPDVSLYLSDGHPKFSEDELRAKMARIEAEGLAPATCQYLSTHSPLCKNCEWFGRIGGPTALGYERLPRRKGGAA